MIELTADTCGQGSDKAIEIGLVKKELEGTLLLLDDERKKRAMVEKEWASERAKMHAAEAQVASELERLVQQLDDERKQQQEREQEQKSFLESERFQILRLVEEKTKLHSQLETQRALQEQLEQQCSVLERARQDSDRERGQAMDQLEHERRQRQRDREMLVHEVSCERALVWRMMDSMQRRREMRESAACLSGWRAWFLRHVKARLRCFLQARRLLCQLLLCWADAVAMETERERAREREREQQVALALEVQLEHERARERGRTDAATQSSPLVLKESERPEPASLNVKDAGPWGAAQHQSGRGAEMGQVEAKSDAMLAAYQQGWMRLAAQLGDPEQSWRLGLRGSGGGWVHGEPSEASHLPPEPFEASLLPLMRLSLCFVRWRLASATRRTLAAGTMACCSLVMRLRQR